MSDIIDSSFTNTNFNTPENLDWSVTIGKQENPTSDNYDGAEVYPEVNEEDSGYYVIITVRMIR